MFTNIEIKAYCRDKDHVRAVLSSHGAQFVGTDLQEDWYFNVPQGRLKLRIGTIENNLIFYNRPDEAGPRQSDFQLVKVEDKESLKALLTSALGLWKLVKKSREIYYIGNVKFHIDILEGIGEFVEIEAGNILAEKSIEELQEACNYYLREFKIEPEDLLQGSYSDMI